MSKTFCIKPWTHACVKTDGQIYLCCQSQENSRYNLNTDTIDNWWNDPLLSEVRDTMLSGDEHPACQLCYETEAKGATSLRQKTNAEYKIFPQYASKMLKHYNYPTESPIEIEFQLTNLCNLKCLMCDSSFSSAIQTENKIFNIEPDTKQYTHSDFLIDEIKQWIKTKPKLMNLRGGEPFMVPAIKELLKWTVDSGLATDLCLHISTNGTKFNSEWFDILKQFKEVRIMLSVDAVEEVNDYTRFGSDWQKIEQNVEYMNQLPNINFLVHAVIQNLTVLHLGKLIDWCYNKGYTFDYEFLLYPEIYRYNNLPQELLTVASQRLKSYNIEFDSVADTELFDKFMEEINLRDRIRHVSILDVLPELGPYWNAKKE